MSEGFGMTNVFNVYKYLVSKKEKLIEYKLVSKDGWNNSGYPLWKDYNFDKRGEGLRNYEQMYLMRTERNKQLLAFARMK